MKKWNKPEVEITEVAATATTGIKPPCEDGVTGNNGTCDYWCKGAGSGRARCEYNGGFCKRSDVNSGSTGSDVITGKLS